MNTNFNMELLPEEIIKTMKKSIYYNCLNFTSYSDINKNYLSLRPSLFSLIHKVSNRMNFKSNTYFLGIYFLDLIFLKNKNPSFYNNNYELLALSCLVLAAKHLENDPTVPHLQYFVSAYNYTLKQLMNNSTNIYNFQKVSFEDLVLSEVMVIKMLNYKLNYFTIYDFNSFFFGHGILKIEQLSDISDDVYSRLNEDINNGDLDDEINYINPSLVKKILEKIYKKSRFYLDNIVKNKICLKYDSFLISLFIMYKSVEYVILKENKMIGEEKNQEKIYIEKMEEKLKRKTLKCFKEIMNDIYKIDLDNLKEYQYLINDENFLKIFNPIKSSNNYNQNNNNKFEFNKNKGADKIHHKIQSNIDIVITESNNDSNKINNNIKTIEPNVKEEFYSKNIPENIPLEKYNKINELKLIDKINNKRKSQNKLTKSFIRMNSNDGFPGKINNSIFNVQSKYLSKSNINVDLNDITFLNSNKIDHKYKKINKDNPNVKLDDDYNEGNNFISQYQDNSSFIRRTLPKKTINNENNLLSFNTIDIEKNNKNYTTILENPNLNKIVIKQENNSNKTLVNLNQKLFDVYQNEIPKTTLKPYSKKVIPKVEKINYKKINISINKIENRNINNKIRSTINSNNNNISYKEIDYNNVGIKNINLNLYKNNFKEKKLDTSIEEREKPVEKFSSIVNSNDDKINLKLINTANENQNTSIGLRKIKVIPLLQNDSKKLSMSVNKIKVNGVSNKHKLNKKLIYGMNKTPIKTQDNLKNALKRNFGVKRNSNNNNQFSAQSKSKNNSSNNSIEEKNKNKENAINIIKKEKKDNKGYSCINLISKEKNLTIHNNPDNDNNNFSNKNIIDLNNNIIRTKIKNDDIMKKENNKNDNISSSSEEDNENDDGENENSSKIYSDKKSGKGSYTIKYMDEIKKNNVKYLNAKRYKIKKIFDSIDVGKNTKSDKNNPKIELIQINKRKSPTIVINNNINVNFDKSIGKAFSKFKNFKIK